MTDDADRTAWGPLAVSVVVAVLLTWGAFSLLQDTDDDELTRFWIRLAVGIAIACGTVWAVARAHWLLATFLALASCITPVSEGWAWVQILCIVLALWALGKFLADSMQGRVR